MDIHSDYYRIGFNRAKIFHLLKEHDLILGPTAQTLPNRKNPDWANSRRGIKRFSLLEAARAISGTDPLHTYSVPDDVQADIKAVSIALEQAAEDGDFLPQGTKEEYGYPVPTFAAQDLAQWADLHGYMWPIPLPKSLANKSSNTTAPTVATMPTLVPKVKPLRPREYNNLHRIIAALLELAREPRQRAVLDSGVIVELTERHKNKEGISKRNLEAVFPEAKRILNTD
jgi:hypothetical protein